MYPRGLTICCDPASLDRRKSPMKTPWHLSSAGRANQLDHHMSVLGPNAHVDRPVGPIDVHPIASPLVEDPARKRERRDPRDKQIHRSTESRADGSVTPTFVCGVLVQMWRDLSGDFSR